MCYHYSESHTCGFTPTYIRRCACCHTSSSTSSKTSTPYPASCTCANPICPSGRSISSSRSTQLKNRHAELSPFPALSTPNAQPVHKIQQDVMRCWNRHQEEREFMLIQGGGRGLVIGGVVSGFDGRCAERRGSMKLGERSCKRPLEQVVKQMG